MVAIVREEGINWDTKMLKYKASVPNLSKLFLDRIPKPIEERGYVIRGYSSEILSLHEAKPSVMLDARGNGTSILGNIYDRAGGEGEHLSLRSADVEGMRTVVSILEERLG